MSTVLVTGGAGFIGSHLVDALLARGDRVRVLDNLDPQAHEGGIPRFLSRDAELIAGDLRDRDAVVRALEGVEYVFHHGGMVGNGQSMYELHRYVDVNAAGTALLLEEVLRRRDRIRRLVAASSMVVYGEGRYRCAEHGDCSPGVRNEEDLRRRSWEPRCSDCGAELQAIAEAAIIDELAAKSVRFNVSQGALVAITPDGAVRAMVGGRNYADSQYNRALTAKRQPGSAFKPFVYLTAIEAGLTPETIRQDAPLDVKGWKPENYGHEYFGAVTLTQALAMSLNTVAVRLGLEFGAKNVVRTAHRLGISSKLDANATIALGTSEVSLTELVGAYAPFANGGLGVSPHVVTRIRTGEGKVLYLRPSDQLGQVIEPRHVAMMNTMMQETLLSGTARKADIPGWTAAGKTGTSQDFRDAWFIGYTASLVTGVWLGNDDNSPTKKATGGGLPVEVWTRFMKAAHQGVPVASLPNSQGSGLFGNLPQVASQVSAPSAQAPAPPVPLPVGSPNRPASARGSVRPQAAAGLDGWLMERLFGR